MKSVFKKTFRLFFALGTLMLVCALIQEYVIGTKSYANWFVLLAEVLGFATVGVLLSCLLGALAAAFVCVLVYASESGATIRDIFYNTFCFVFVATLISKMWLGIVFGKCPATFATGIDNVTAEFFRTIAADVVFSLLAGFAVACIFCAGVYLFRASIFCGNSVLAHLKNPNVDFDE